MEEFILNNQWVILLAIIWTIPWKGFALWQSARQNEKWWFIVLLVVNTLGLLEILYIFIFGKKKTLPAAENN